MYSELIYTRCKQGIDIESGKPISGEGKKVYSCTPSLLKEDHSVLKFMLEAAQEKHPYSPSFMDDAYLYFVPDKGDSFMLDFYPVPYNPNTKGNYSHRDGNYVNHILMGDFSEFYPFELFRDDSVWNAKVRGEAYYYENPPADLPPRKDISDPVGQFGIAEIGEFISDGRKEALKSAVSFLISQYEHLPEERKFLVIRDESSKKIELWIAAIECAFSPRIASSIPFATRMKDLTSKNRYTVNQMGEYTQINMLDKNQKNRYRAIIVGVDEHDNTNGDTAFPLANSAFVLLDGKTKRATFEADTSCRYFPFITSFNDAHQSFCREFLQMINIIVPNTDIYGLLDIFLIFENDFLPNASTMAEILTILSKYTLFNSSKLKNIYAHITAELPRFLQEDLRSALQIIKWLQIVSHTVNDTNATARLSDIVSKVFTEQVYRKPDVVGTFDFWQNIKNSEFAANVASNFIDPLTLQANQEYLLQFEFVAAIAFVLIYLDCAAFLGKLEEQDSRSIVSWGLLHCYNHKDADSARKILKTLSQNQCDNIQDILFSIAGNAENDFAEYIIKLLIEYDKRIVITDSAMMSFLKKLSAEKLEHLYGAVLKSRALILTRPFELEQMIKSICELKLSGDELRGIFTTLDQKISLMDKNYFNFAAAIQKEKPKTVACKKSAHLYALDILNRKSKKGDLADYFTDLVAQGFPSENSVDYISLLNKTLFKVELSQKDVEFIVKTMYRNAPQEYIYDFIGTICANASKYGDKWNIVIYVATTSRDHLIFDTIVDVISNMKQSEKVMDQLNGLLQQKKLRDYFKQVAEKVKEINRAKKSQSGFSKLFKLFLGDDDGKHT